MKRHRLSLNFRRGYATKYSGRVVTSADNGRSFAVEVDSPNLQTDTRGYSLPRRDLICKITKIIHSSSSSSSDPFLDLTDYLQTLALTLTPAEASEVLKSIKSPRLALDFFRFCPSNIPKFRHDAFTYNRILLILSRSVMYPVLLISCEYFKVIRIWPDNVIKISSIAPMYK